MLRDTAKKLLKSKMNKRRCTLVVEAIHTSFTPRLTWAEKSILTKKVFDYKKYHHGWNVEKVAEYLELNYYTVAENLRLAEGINNYPNLKFVTNRKLALRAIASPSPVEVIDAMLYDKGITKETVDISE